MIDRPNASERAWGMVVMGKCQGRGNSMELQTGKGLDGCGAFYPIVKFSR